MSLDPNEQTFTGPIDQGWYSLEKTLLAFAVCVATFFLPLRLVDHFWPDTARAMSILWLFLYLPILLVAIGAGIGYAATIYRVGRSSLAWRLILDAAAIILFWALVLP